jgi:hypothetical protein
VTQGKLCTHRTVLLSAFVLFQFVPPAVSPLDAADQVFLAVNPYTDQTEAVWVGTPQGAPATEIFHSIQTGEQWSASTRLTNDSADDALPHLAFTSAGDRRVAWEHHAGGSTVLFSARPASGGSWSTPEMVSDGTEDARNPRVAVHDGEPFVAYESVPASGNSKIVVGRSDTPDPFSRTQVATAGSAGSPLVRICSEDGHLWVSWVDTGTELGFAEYANGTWGSVHTESYSGTSDIEPGRERIRALVLE